MKLVILDKIAYIVGDLYITNGVKNGLSEEHLGKFLTFMEESGKPIKVKVDKSRLEDFYCTIEFLLSAPVEGYVVYNNIYFK